MINLFYNYLHMYVYVYSYCINDALILAILRICLYHMRDTL